QLLHGHQRLRLVGGDEGAGGDAGLAGAAVDRGDDAGVAEVDLGRIQRRLGGGDAGLGLGGGGDGAFVVLLADQLARHQLGGALGGQARGLGGGAGAGQVG